MPRTGKRFMLGMFQRRLCLAVRFPLLAQLPCEVPELAHTI